ncbi:hypothetical protein [Sagittula sp. S175]|uniref:hypothetical protein n=1 Tax=Sagittula sp. S175 TaxID=3415129 RepID=UPI003C79CE68
MSFVVGPALCALLLRMPATLRVLVSLAILEVMMMGAALFLRDRAPAPSLVALWLGWVAACAMIAHALRRRIASPRARRWITVIAILATTLPWFGLATARLIG